LAPGPVSNPWATPRLRAAYGAPPGGAVPLVCARPGRRPVPHRRPTTRIQQRGAADARLVSARIGTRCVGRRRIGSDPRMLAYRDNRGGVHRCVVLQPTPESTCVFSTDFRYAVRRSTTDLPVVDH